MGLFYIDKEKPTKCGIGYAVRIKTEGGYFPAIKNSHTIYKLGVEYTAEKIYQFVDECHCERREGRPNISGTTYPLGFHLFRSIKTARQFLKALNSNLNNYVIVQYHYDEAHTSGRQGYDFFEGKVIVALKVTILREMKCKNT